MHLEEHLPFDLPERTDQAFARGVPARTLLAQVEITMPYLENLPSDSGSLRYLQILKAQRLWHRRFLEGETFLDHSGYFELCVSAHFATCGSFVPTDVDNQIRFKLWHPALPTDQMLQMVDTVLEARTWNVRPVTTRLLEVPPYLDPLTGHRGEWLTISAGAYGALRKKFPDRAAEILDLIRQEVAFEAQSFKLFKKNEDGLGLLKCCAFLAHNLGDLQRVIDMWNLEADDPLFDFARDMLTKKYENGILLEAGALYKALMAPECHRFFAMRSAKCLRQSPDFLIPVGPFFDDWGKTITRHPLLSVRDIAQVAECLIDGFAKLKNSIGYARALCGIETHFPGGASALQRELPSRIEKAWKTGPLRQNCSVPKERFEAQWAGRALKFLRDFKG